MNKIDKPSAQIICDSVAPNGKRLVTFVAQFHRFILAELNTHCAFARNSASSRAIPSAVMLERVKENPALPISWGSNKPGMQAGAEIDETAKNTALAVWSAAANNARHHVGLLTNLGLHKQTANRLLEPWLWHTAIITMTEIDNFFWQRCDPAAQPEMKALADAMQYAYYMGDPIPMQAGMWHVPFADDNRTIDECIEVYCSQFDDGRRSAPEEEVNKLRVQLSMARCARVSYLQQDGTRDLVKDFDLYDRLLTGMHPSPSEHQGTPYDHLEGIKEYNEGLEDLGELTLEVRCRLQGKFGTGWHQHRKMLPNENRLNFIPNLPELAAQAEILKAGGKLW